MTTSTSDSTGTAAPVASPTSRATRSGQNTGLTPKLQALVYNILPSTTAVFSYAIGSRKLSANEQFVVGAQTVVSLLQTTEIKQGVSFIAANKVYTSANKTTIVQSFESRRNSFFHPGGCVSCLRTCFGARLPLQSYQYPNLVGGR